MPVVMLNYGPATTSGGGPPQTPTYVQGNTNLNGSALTASASVTLTNPVGAGNMVVISLGAVGLLSTDTVTFTDNLSNTYTVTFATPIVNTTAGYGVAAAYLSNIPSGPITFTATISNARTFLSVVADEWSGITPTSPLDVAGAGQAQNAAGTGTDAITSGSITTVTNGDLIYGFSVSINSFGLFVGTGFTLHQNVASTFYTEGLLQTTAGLVAATFTSGNATDNNITYVLAFKHG